MLVRFLSVAACLSAIVTAVPELLFPLIESPVSLSNGSATVRTVAALAITSAAGEASYGAGIGSSGLVYP